MSTTDDLLALERRFWTGGPDFYRGNLDDTCLIAFTEMIGAFGKDDIAKSVTDEDRWRAVDIAVKGVVEPSPGVALLTYDVGAVRASGEPYRALVSSGYVRRDGAWKMAFHQQTPLPGNPQ